MPKYNVLMTTNDYVEVEANNHIDAEMVALNMYRFGEIRPEHPVFICEEADLINDEEDEDA